VSTKTQILRTPLSETGITPEFVATLGEPARGRTFLAVVELVVEAENRGRTGRVALDLAVVHLEPAVLGGPIERHLTELQRALYAVRTSEQPTLPETNGDTPAEVADRSPVEQVRDEIEAAQAEAEHADAVHSVDLTGGAADSVYAGEDETEAERVTVPAGPQDTVQL